MYHLLRSSYTNSTNLVLGFYSSYLNKRKLINHLINAIMKKSVVIAILLVCISIFKINAQEPAKTLFTTPNIKQLGLYVAPEYQYGQIKNQFTSIGGASVMLLLNQKFAVGFTGQRSLDQSFSPSGISPLYLHAGMGGLKMEYTPKPTSAIHLSFPLFIGMGFAQADSNYTGFRVNNNDSMMRANRANQNDYFIIQPGVTIEANVIKYVKVFAGVNYRFAFNRDNTNTLSSSTMTGFSANIGVKVGLFDYTIHKKNQ